MTAAILMEQTDEARQLESGDALFEVIYGRVVEKQPMSVFAGKLASMLTYLLTNFVLPRRLGLVVSEVLFVLDEAKNLQRRPDVAFVSNERWVGDDPDADRAWETIPDLAVEVISPSNTSNEIDRKVLDYFAAGVRLVWVLHPETRRLHVYDSADTIHVVSATGTLDGGTVLPGFQLVLGELFEAVEKPAS